MALRPKVDGFMYNTSLLLMPNRYLPFALGQLEFLRRANNYRARWWAVPDDEGEPIAAFDTFQFQVNVAPGSYLWGYMFSVNPTLSPGALVTDLLVSAVDSCTGVPLFNDFANCGGANSNGNAKMLPVMMSKPRLVLAPGLVNVEIANRSNATRNCQLVLMFAEPCRVIDEAGCEECR